MTRRRRQPSGIGYAPKGILRGTAAIPVRLEDGTLVGYVGITEARSAVDPSAALFMNDDSFIGANHYPAIAEIAKYSVPAVWGQEYIVANGALIGYGGDVLAAFRSAGDYAGLILAGTAIADLPIQTTRFGLSVNLKTAKALGIAIPVTILARADEVSSSCV